jgi:hypothetical protein
MEIILIAIALAVIIGACIAGDNDRKESGQ